MCSQEFPIRMKLTTDRFRFLCNPVVKYLSSLIFHTSVQLTFSQVQTSTTATDRWVQSLWLFNQETANSSKCCH